jgi:hypothetical protein
MIEDPMDIVEHTGSKSNNTQSQLQVGREHEVAIIQWLVVDEFLPLFIEHVSADQIEHRRENECQAVNTDAGYELKDDINLV